MNRWTSLAPIIALAALAACSPQAAQQAPAIKRFAVLEAQARNGGVMLSGEAAAGAEILNGEAVLTRADDQGRWSHEIAAAPEMLDLRLSAKAGTSVQAASGPLLILPGGGAVLLAPGDGARWLGAVSAVQTRVQAVDYDTEGGVIVSGHAPPMAAILIRIGQTRRGSGEADAAGRFSIVLESALPLGRHVIEVSGGAAEDEVELDLTAPASPAPQRLKASRSGQSWRIDWLTPSGAVQTTLLPGAAR